MAIQFASGALKSRDTPQSQWEDAIVAVRVNDVAVQDTTPTGTEHIWVDTDDPGEVVVPTIEDHNVLANAIGIVVDGNKSALGATTGQYVILQNSTITGKDDGLYTAAQTIPANTVIDGTYLTAVSGGGLNSVMPEIINSGNWEVVKWANGNCDLYYNDTDFSYTATAQRGSLYYYDGNFNLPITLQYPIVTSGSIGGNVAASMPLITNLRAYQTTVNFSVGSLINTQVTGARLSLIIHGHWK